MTPDTHGYLIAGTSVIFGIILLYLIILGIRIRHLRQQIRMLTDEEHRQVKD